MTVVLSRRSCSGIMSVTLTYIIAKFLTRARPRFEETIESLRGERVCPHPDDAFAQLAALCAGLAMRAGRRARPHMVARRTPAGLGAGRAATRASSRSRTPLEWLMAATLDVAARENAGHVVQDVGSRVLVVAGIRIRRALTMSIFSWVSLSTTLETRLVSLIVSFLVLEEFKFQGLLEPFVGPVIELLAVKGQCTDVIHDLAAEVVTALSGMSIFSSMDRISRSIRLFGLSGVLVPDLLPLSISLDVVDVVAAEPRQRQSSSAAMARCTSFFTMPRISSSTTRASAGSACAFPSLLISE